MIWQRVGIIYLAAMNLIAFLAMGIDKKRAKAHAWRIPERTLFLLGAAGGSLGAWMGMYAFRHKTKHWYFVAGMPAIVFVHAVILVMFHVRFFL